MPYAKPSPHSPKKTLTALLLLLRHTYKPPAIRVSTMPDPFTTLKHKYYNSKSDYEKGELSGILQGIVTYVAVGTALKIWGVY